MIYIYKNASNTITTDSWLAYIPTSITIYLNDILIGSYINESTRNEYIVLTIPAADLSNLEAKEYNLKLINNDNATLIKIELVIFKKPLNITTNTVTNNLTQKFYE